MWKIDYKNERNIEPWATSFSERSLYLRNCIRNGYKIALHLHGEPNASTFRYRCYNVYQWLKNSKKWRSIYFFDEEIANLEFNFSDILCVIITRMEWSFKLQRFIDKLKNAGVIILFDTDDLVFDIEKVPLVVNTINGDIDYYFSYVARISLIASYAEGFTATNNFLGGMLQAKFNRPYAIIPNSLCQEQLEVSQDILTEKRKIQQSKPFVIGYFSGTPSHYNDFMGIYPEIVGLLDKYPQIQLNIVGFMDLPKEATPFVKANRIIFDRLVDIFELQRLIAQVDVNIAPLVINTFTECKSELKYFEAAIVETVTCASPTGIFKECIISGENGFLCKQGEWFDTIEALYLSKVDRERIILKARTHALERYSGKNITNQIENAYDFFVDKLEVKEK